MTFTNLAWDMGMGMGMGMDTVMDTVMGERKREMGITRKLSSKF